MMKLLIAEGTEEFRQALTDNLRGSYQIQTCQDGNEAFEIIKTFRPDLMVLDLMLPGLDGISLLQRVSAAGMQPMVLATTRFVNDYVMEAIDRLDIGYILRKPCDVMAVIDRLSDLTERLKQPVFTKPDEATMVSNLLLSLGIATNLRGYAYLRDAILSEMHRPRQMVTKELYPAVGKLYGANGVQVERSIRDAINKAWLRRDDRLWRLYFQTGPDGTLRRPTNAYFISRLAERLRTGWDPAQELCLTHSAAE